MPRSSVTTISAIQKAGYELFHNRGYARVSMDDIALAAGVTKRTLYYHYDSKDALVGAVLTQQLSQSLDSIRRWGEPKCASVPALIDSIFSQLAKWAETERWTGSGFTRLTLELADMPGHPARRAASRHKSDVETWLQQELDRLGVEDPCDGARALCLLIEGATVLSLIHGDTKYMSSAGDTAQKLFKIKSKPK